MESNNIMNKLQKTILAVSLAILILVASVAPALAVNEYEGQHRVVGDPSQWVVGDPSQWGEEASLSINFTKIEL
jgi:hypothetical protein